MKEPSTIHSVDTEVIIYSVSKLSFSKQYKSVLILYARASQTFSFCGPSLKNGFSMRSP